MRSRSPHSQLIVLTVLPFLLLSSSRSASVHTTVYLDGTVRRELKADFLEDRRGDVIPEITDALPNADRMTVAPAGDGRQATRSLIIADVQDLDGASLDFLDTAAQPLSLFTEYTWKETLRVPADTATAVEKAGLSQAKFEYRITMPGRIEEATAMAQRAPAKTAPAATTTPNTPPPTPSPRLGEGVQTPPPAAPAGPTLPVAPGANPQTPATPEAAATPAESALPVAPATPVAPAPVATPATPPTVAPAPASDEAKPAGSGGGMGTQADVSGSTATFTLTAAHDRYLITVTSRRVRWGYLLTLLYILAFIAYRITAFLVHRASLKPKRI